MRKERLTPIFFRRQWLFVAFMGEVVMFLFGCSDGRKEEGRENLIICDDRVVTVSEYNKVLAVAKASYSFDVIQDKKAFKAIKVTILNQLIEEMVLLRMAKEKEIIVSDEDLKKAVDVIREDYPEEEFKKALLENVVSYDVWEKRLRKRLLMEKVVKAVFEPLVTVSDREIADHMKTLETGTETLDKEQVMAALRRKKIEETYKTFILEYKEKYKIEIDDAQWSKIIGD